jgi:hypothetical protein
MAAKRPGLQNVSQLPRELRVVLEPHADLLLRVTGVTTPMLVALGTFNDPLLNSATATTVQIADRVNDLQLFINDVALKVNEVISRLQED